MAIDAPSEPAPVPVNMICQEPSAGSDALVISPLDPSPLDPLRMEATESPQQTIQNCCTATRGRDLPVSVIRCTVGDR